MVIEVADEGGYGALEVDVVLPQRIVSVDQQRLAWRKLRHESMVMNLTDQDSCFPTLAQKKRKDGARCFYGKVK
jgi:hypothetical protein